MTSHQINKAIAVACRWSHVTVKLTGKKQKLVGIPPGKSAPACVPNFNRNLNAMHRAEEYLGVDREYNYGEHLRRLSGNVGPKGGHYIPNGWGCFSLAHLGASKRAEAFLCTLGKWKA